MPEPAKSPGPTPLVAIGRAEESCDFPAIAAFARLASEGEPAALVMVVGAEGSAPRGMGAAMAVRSDGTIVGTVGGGGLELLAIAHAQDAMRDGRARRYHYDFSGGKGQNLEKACLGKMDLYIQPAPARPRLYIFGAGHVAAALAPMAVAGGFTVTVLDDRPGYPDPARFPAEARLVAAPFLDCIETLRFDPLTYIAVVTYGHTQDEAVVGACLRRPWRYLGMIGSRAKVARVKKALGTNEEAVSLLARIHAPIGFDLGGRSPGEIAVGIAAEIQAVRYGREEVAHRRGGNGTGPRRAPKVGRSGATQPSVAPHAGS